MLAEKFFDKPERVEGKEFALTTKIDGGRIIAIKENGQVSFFTRAGQKYEGLVDLENELKEILDDNFVLDGEITLLDPKGLSSKDQYKETMKITRKDGEKHGVKMLVFDYMPVANFKMQNCPVAYSARRAHLSTMFDLCALKYFELLPLLYVGSDVSVIPKCLDEAIADGQEGIMINICDAPYEFKRTWNLLKVKKMNTMDLQIIGFEEGTGRLAGTLGAILVRYKNRNTVKVGSGFTDWLRTEIWNNRGKYMDTICEIKYFEETTNQEGGESLRFPIFNDFRPDKLEADF
jgi:DNA ligase-1